MMQEDLYTALQGTFGGRFYAGMAPATVTLPYAVYSIIARVQPNTVNGGAAALKQSRVQIDVFSTSYSEAQTKADAVETALHAAAAFKAIPILRQDLYEDEVRLHRVSMDWSVHHA